MSLSQDQAFVLHVPEEAASTHPQAAVLGAPLEAGENMYRRAIYNYQHFAVKLVYLNSILKMDTSTIHLCTVVYYRHNGLFFYFNLMCSIP